MLFIPAHPLSAFVRAGDWQPLAVVCNCRMSFLVLVSDGMYHYCMHGMQVDPVGLGEGLHYAEVQAFDSKARWRGPLFRCNAPPMHKFSDTVCI